VARIFITGSADGLGRMAAQLLASARGGGHDVILHARNERRAEDARRAVPEAYDIVVGDLSSMAEVRRVAEQVNQRGPVDAAIHNAAVGDTEPRRLETVDGLAHVFAVNVLAPYMLTALINVDRLVYISSGMMLAGVWDLDDAQWTRRRWSGSQAYSDSKLYLTALAFAVARRRPGVRSNSVDPGWVPTRMGGAGASDDLSLAPITQAKLAVGRQLDGEIGDFTSDVTVTNEVTGEHFFHERPARVHPDTRDPERQDELLAYCAKLAGETL